jgi:hypothetical protein
MHAADSTAQQESRAIMTQELNRDIIDVANSTIAPDGVTPEALATMGEGQIAYVKSIRSEDVPHLFPQAPKLSPGLKLFALHAANGAPIMLTDSIEAAIANAWSHELQTVSVH